MGLLGRRIDVIDRTRREKNGALFAKRAASSRFRERRVGGSRSVRRLETRGETRDDGGVGERAPETSDPLISGGRGCGERDEDVVSFFFFDGEDGARQKALRSRKNPRRAATTAAANRRFPIRFGHPERFRAVFASHEGGAGRRACA